MDDNHAAHGFSVSVDTDAFDPSEATIQSLHDAYLSGRYRCESLVDYYLSRIAALDRSGSRLNAFTYVNPHVKDEARALDKIARQSPGNIGSLHGIPIAVKDNIDVRNMPTSGGLAALAQARPIQDAFIIRKLRRAGALVIGKTNLHELALGGTTVSTLGGQTKNPYALDRTPGGSSGGTGVAITTNMSMVGIGTDTGQSVRSPASALGLVGIRPSYGLVSRAGVMPTSFTQDTVGPLTRTVEDAARVLEVITGFDARDPSTAVFYGRGLDFRAHLTEGALKNVRIGIVEQLFGSEPRHAAVNAVIHCATKKMEAMGANLTPVDIPDLEALTEDQATATYEMQEAFDEYVRESLGLGASHSLSALLSNHSIHPSVYKSVQAALASGGTRSPEYGQIFVKRARLRNAVLLAMARASLDALLYPHQRVVVARIGADKQPERNGVLSNATGMPAICFPAGFTESATHEGEIPVGVEILGREGSEPRLIGYAYAFQCASHHRRLPTRHL